jgi:hypothetical protein
MKLNKVLGASAVVAMACATFIGSGTSASAEEPKTKIDPLVHMDRWEDFEGNKAISAYATVTVPDGATLDANGFEWVITRYNEGIVSGGSSAVDMSEVLKDVVSGATGDDENGAGVISVTNDEDSEIVFDNDKASEAVGADEHDTAAVAETAADDETAESDIIKRISANVGSVTVTNADVVLGLIITFDNSESDRILYDSIYDIRLEEALD